METDEEKKRRELRQEAQRDTQITLEREKLQKDERKKQHDRSLKEELRVLEYNLQRASTSLGALTLESKQLERGIQGGYRVSSRKDHDALSEADRVLHHLRSEFDALHREIAEVENKISAQERAVARAREVERKTEDTEEKAFSAKRRKEEHDRQAQVLTREIGSLKEKIQDIKRELTH